MNPNGFLSAIDIETERLQPQQGSSTAYSESPSEFPGFAISNQRIVETNANWKPQHEGLEHKPLHVLPGHDLAQHSSSHMQVNLLNGESPGNKKKLQVEVPSEQAKEMGSVLDALQSAKLLLSNKLSRSPFSKEDGQLGRALELKSPVPGIRAGNGMDLPVGYGRPGRLTIDLQPEGVPPRSNTLSSSPGFRMYHPEMGVAVSVGNQVGAGHRTEPRPRISVARQSVEPHLYRGRGQYSHNPYVNLMQGMPSDNQI